MTPTDFTPDQAAPSPSAVMTQMMAGFQVSQAVYVIAKLDIATQLDDAGWPEFGAGRPRPSRWCALPDTWTGTCNTCSQPISRPTRPLR